MYESNDHVNLTEFVILKHMWQQKQFRENKKNYCKNTLFWLDLFTPRIKKKYLIFIKFYYGNILCIYL